MNVNLLVTFWALGAVKKRYLHACKSLIAPLHKTKSKTSTIYITIIDYLWCPISRAWSIYKDIWIYSFHLTHTDTQTEARKQTGTHAHTHAHTHTRMHYWWWVGRMRREKKEKKKKSVCRREEMGFQFWLSMRLREESEKDSRDEATQRGMELCPSQRESMQLEL